MAIAFITAGNHGEQAGSSDSFSFNNTSGDFLTVDITCLEETPYVTVSSVQWGSSGGVAGNGVFTSRSRVTHPTTMGWVERLHLKNAPTGTNTLSISLSGAPDYAWFATIRAWTGVDQTTHWDASEGSYTTPEATSVSASVTTVTNGAMLVGAIANYNGINVIAPGGSQVEDTAINAGSDCFVSHKPAPTAGVNTISYSFGSTERVVLNVGALRPASGASAGGPLSEGGALTHGALIRGGRLVA